MELRQLRYFVRIVDLGSLSKAAADLYVAQPALSRQVAALEAELGAPLLVRTVRGVTPTDAGTALYRQAQAMLRQVSRVADEVRSAGALPAGDVSIGLPYSASNVLAPALLGAVRERLPGVRLLITEAVSGVLEDQLAAGRLDIGMLYETERRASPMEERALLVEELFLVTAAAARRAPREVALADAMKLPFILPGRNNATRRILEQAVARAGGRVQVIAEVDSASTIKAMVAAGHGATVMSRSALHPEGDHRLALQRVVRPALTRALSICASAGTPTRATARVRELLEETALALVRRGTWKGATPVARPG